MQSDELITVKNEKHRYTLITVNDWQLYNDAVSGWVRLDRELLDNSCWKHEAEYMGILFWLMLNTDYTTGQIVTSVI